MPLPTAEQARTMLNERFLAFAETKEECDKIEPEFAQQVYRTLTSRKAFTFREFIKECLRRFESGDFSILTLNPVSIKASTLKDILHLLRENTELSDGFDEILNSSMSAANKNACFRLLVQIFMQKSCSEDSEIFQKNGQYFFLLRKAGLITENVSLNKIYWTVSEQLKDFDNAVKNKFDYSLDEYFLKIFKGRLELKDEMSTFQGEEFRLMEELMDRLRKRNDSNLTPVQSCLNVAFASHKQIVSDIGRTSNPVGFNKLRTQCKVSIGSLSNAVATHAGLPANGIEFWKDFWYYPGSLYQYSKVLQTQSSAVEPSNIYLFTAYENAFTEIVTFLLDQVIKSDIMTIPVKGLKTEEIKEFDKARADYSKAKYMPAAHRISDLVENKIREFIYSVFALQYGDINHRLQRIPIKFHDRVRVRMGIDGERGFTRSRNEITYLNRDNYFDILVAYDGIGYDNWINTFSKIFAGWKISQMRSYLNLFYQLNLISAHNKEGVLTPINQSDIYQFIIESIRFIVMINRSYLVFLHGVKKSQIPGSSEVGYYFSLGEDKYLVQPVRVSDANRKRIINLLEDSINSIDLSYATSLEERYGVADLLNDRTYGETKVIKENEPIITLKIK